MKHLSLPAVREGVKGGGRERCFISTNYKISRKSCTFHKQIVLEIYSDYAESESTFPPPLPPNCPQAPSYTTDNRNHIWGACRVAESALFTLPPFPPPGSFVDKSINYIQSLPWTMY